MRTMHTSSMSSPSSDFRLRFTNTPLECTQGSRPASDIYDIRATCPNRGSLADNVLVRSIQVKSSAPSDHDISVQLQSARRSPQGSLTHDGYCTV
jgi:hypothetical protein